MTIAAHPIRLGELIAKLAALAPDTQVTFDFCDLRPTRLDSYRGYYEQLALGWTVQEYGKEDGRLDTVGQLLAECRGALGRAFEGYKGGEYVMHERTPVWVANYGRSGSTALVDVVDEGYGYARLVTAYIPQ